MELKEFVTETLVQIVDGVQSANQRLAGDEPPGPDRKAFLLAYSGGGSPMGQSVEFDVAVSVATGSGGGAGAKAKLYVAEVKLDGSKSKFEESKSRVRFSVLVKQHQG